MSYPRLVTFLHRLINWLAPPPTAAEALLARMGELEERISAVEQRLDQERPPEDGDGPAA